MLSFNLSLFDNYIKLNNKLIGVINADILVNKINIETPIEQRLLDKTKVQEIVDYQDSYYKSGKNKFNFLGSINIHYCSETNKNYLIDGQHRFNALKCLINKNNYKDIKIMIEVIQVELYCELKENYKLINTNTELPQFPDNIDKSIPERVSNYFFNEYQDIFKTKRKPARPFINKNDFQEALGFLCLKYKEYLDIDICEDTLKNIIIEKNKKMINLNIESYRTKIRKLKKWDDYKLICDNYKFYLGMYNSVNEDFIFKWIVEIIDEHTGNKIKPKRKKRKIPKQIRANVWSEWIGDKTTGVCFSCRQNKLQHMTNWECGHIISDKDGGDLSISNLRPLCSTCNKSMGARNMKDYVKEFYPKNYKFIDSKQKIRKKSFLKSIF
jgi:hypothetical protein